MSIEFLWVTLMYLVVGFVAGIASGLIGFGGGFIVVPVLYWGLHLVGVSGEITMHIAIGTSLVVMLAAALNGTQKHHKRGGVCKDLCLRFIPFIALGTLVASLVTNYLTTHTLHYLFLAYILLALVHSLVRKGFSQLEENAEPIFPSRWVSGIIGFFLGLFSASIGVGGSVLSVPYLRQQKFPMKRAVGTALSFTLPVSIVGTIGYMFAGHGATGLPPYSFGFVYLPAAAGLIAGNVCGVPIGVKCAHNWKDRTIARAYLSVLSILLVVSALQH